MEMMDHKIGEKYFKNNSVSSSRKIEIWKSKGLSSESNDIKMSKPIRRAYVIFIDKESFFEQKKKIL